MFGLSLIVVVSLLKLSGCMPSDPVKRNVPGGPRCYSCPSVKEPYLCNVTTQCGPDEQCYTEEFSTTDGTNIFSVGCRRISECYRAIVRRSVSSRGDVQRLKCVECCHGNQCNLGGCSAGLGKSNICYNCRFIKDPQHCQHETMCQGNEHCFIEKVLTQSYDIKYIQGCVENAECETLRQFGPIVGKRDTAISTLCASCCYEDKCNDVCSPQGFTRTTHRTSSATSTHSVYKTTSTAMIEDTTIIDTTNSESFTSDFIVKDTTTVEISQMPDTSHSMTKDTTTLDTTNRAQSSSLPKSTGTEFSTMGQTVTAPPSTNTTSPSTSTTTSPSTSTSASTFTVCQKECAGSIECDVTDLQLCRSPSPYCFTVLDKHASGSYNISKRCADRNMCNDKWLKQTSGDNRCVFFNPAIKDTFTCFYCCTAHKCNMQSFPPYMSSLFRGTE